MEETNNNIKEVLTRILTERQKRMTVMSLLLSALVFTVIYGTLENPFQYTFSKIGNRFDPALRVMFIIWASYTGFCIQAAILALFRLENYTRKRNYTFIILSIVFLVLTAMAPSLDHLPLWIWVHIITAGLFGLFITLGFTPFMRWVAQENPRLRRIVYIWLGIIWGGSFLWMFVLGNTGVFELWFFGSFIVFLLYLSLTLFEEQIIKESVHLFRDETDINQAIDVYFSRKKGA